MTTRRPLRLIGMLTTGALGLMPVLLAAPAHAAPISCSANGTTLTVEADDYFYDQRWSIESGLLTIHDGAAASGGVQCSVPLSGIDVINVNAGSAFADDWVVDLSSDWSGLLLNLPAGQYDTVRLDGSSSTGPVTLDFVGDGTPYAFSTDGDLGANVTFDGQWGGFRGAKGGSSADTIDLSGLPSQTPAISLLGNDGNDTISGSDSHDTISGGNGDDVINGGGQMDVIDGNTGDDELYGGDGSDVVHDAEGSDTLDGDSPDAEDGYGDVLNVFYDYVPDLIGDATASFDKVVFYSDGQPVEASLDGAQNDGVLGEDNLLGVHAIQTFQGDDQVTADGFTTVDTGAGDDRLILGPHYRDPIGWGAGAGTDTIDASGFSGFLAGQFGPGGAQLFTQSTDGFGGNIDGNGWEVVLGGDGDDDLVANCACTMKPGPGNDTITFGGAGTFLASAAGDGADTVLVQEGVTGVTASYTGRSAAVSLTIDGDANDGQSGEGDLLDFGITILTGGTGNDTLAGSTAADTLDGFAGDDRLLGRGGSDRLVGDVGADVLDGGSGADLLLGQEGADKLYGRDGDDVLRGDERTGPAGNDTLDGGAGDDDLFGYAGNDTFTEGSSANGSDLIAGGSGTDTASYSLRSSAVRLSINGAYDDGASGEGDRIGTDVENLTGGRGADVLTGNSAVNLLTGGAGNDLLTGGSGKDKLNGLDGNDTFQTVDSLADALSGGSGTDRAHRDSIDTTTSVEQRF